MFIKVSIYRESIAYIGIGIMCSFRKHWGCKISPGAIIARSCDNYRITHWVLGEDPVRMVDQKEEALNQTRDSLQ